MANFIKNGTFEINTPGSTGQIPQGWSVTSGSPDHQNDDTFEWSSYLERYLPTDLDAASGRGYFALSSGEEGSGAPYSEAAKTTLNTQIQAGETYTFTFDFFVNSNVDGTEPQPSSTELIVTIGSQQISVPLDSTGVEAPYWQSISFDFVAKETTNTFSIGTDGVLDPSTGQPYMVVVDNLVLDVASEIVDGTAGGDNITLGYVDPENDQIDNADNAAGTNDDSVRAGDGDDTIHSFEGNDTIDAGAGSDWAAGYGGDDYIDGGFGDDTLYGGIGQDTLLGSYGSDELHGNDGDDFVDGGAGNDLITGDLGHDTLLGNTGNDTIYGATGNDSVLGGSGDDLLYGEGGKDTVSAGEGADTVYGGSEDDLIDGGAGNDLLLGNEGNDTIYGRAGRDTLNGGADNDVLRGGEGDDIVSGGSGNDVLHGDDGNDTLTGGSGDDIIVGGADADTIITGNDYGDDTVDGGEGRETVDGSDIPSDYAQLSGVIISDQLNNSMGVVNSFATGELGYMTSNVYAELSDVNGQTLVPDSNGLGQQTVGILEVGNEVYVNGVRYTVTDETGSYADVSYNTGGSSQVATGASISVFTLSNGTNTIYAQLISQMGDDVPTGAEIESFEFTETFDGGPAVLGIGYNEAGTEEFTAVNMDEAVAGYGGDILDASEEDADQELVFSGDEAGTLSNVNDTIDFTNMEKFTLGDGDDTANAAATTLGTDIDAGAGNDTLYGGTGDDTLDGGVGDDRFVLGDGYGNDVINGGDERETVDGSTIPSDYVQLSGIIISDQLNNGLETDYSFANGALDYMTGNVFAELDTDLANVPGKAGVEFSSLPGVIGVLQVGNEVYVNGQPFTVTAQAGSWAKVTFDAGNGPIVDEYGMVSIFTLSNGSDTIYAQMIAQTGNDIPAGAEILGFEFTTLDPLGSDAPQGIGYNEAGTEDFTAATVNEIPYSAPLSTSDGGADYLDASGEDDDQTLTFTTNGAGTLSNGADTVTFTGIDEVELGDGADIVNASATDKGIHVQTGAGDDTITGGAGADFISSEEGSDVIEGGAGDDVLFLGATDGAVDTVIFSDGDGEDLVHEFEIPTIDGATGDITSHDQIDVSDLTDTNGDPVNVHDVTVSENADGNAVLGFPNGESITLVGISQADVDSHEMLIAMGIPGSDFIVSGTNGDDTIDVAYTGDPDGDMVDAFDNMPEDNNDVIEAGAGDDTIISGAGNDSIDGGDDQDEIVLKNGFGEDTINGGEGGIDYDILDAGDVTGNLIVDLSANGANDPESGTISYEGAPAGFHYIRVFEPNDPSIIDSRGVYPKGNIDFNDGVFHMLLVEDNDTMLGDTQGGSRIVDHTQAAARDLGGLDISGFNVGSPGKSTFVDANGDRFEVGWLQSYGSGGTTTVPNGTFLIVTDTSAGGAPVGTSTSTGYENAIADFRYSSFTGGQTTSEFTEIEEVILGSGDDVVIGSSGGDKVLTGAGADTVYGGAGDDEIYGDAGDDVIKGGTGNDTISGGDGNDTFVYSAGDGADTITDFGTDDSGSINDGDNSNNDFVDLSGFYNTTTLAAVNGSDSDPSNDIKTALHMLRADAADGAIDGIIDGVDHSASIGDIDLTLLSAGSAVVGDDLTFDNTGVPCFVSGTLITTARGLVPVEELQAGDRVQTRDNGFRKIVWVGSKKAAATGKLAPIRIEKGLLQNDRALWLSPNHRILHVNWQAELMFGETEVLHSAKTLLGTSGVRQVEGGSVSYFHILFEQHEIIRSEGTWTESFHPGQVGLGALSNETRDEILELFPELQSTTASYGGTARVSLHTYEAKLLLAA
ncbi:Ca2+-binding RTX toxin-like protein [Sulfitobacter undariae]|uniref:Ca2+-binding RTX toxin-like protein n=1 Tax=Sulfitobacter undariae TaxID=1563671 RepID=A0A7W6E6E4_9RHOB|nr:Hint domain-containing protein [Sulfitobacter undariae]MBB3995602.1 Ca2+-binding RTX toxin-like protein [Sulfitobacter undariae]